MLRHITIVFFLSYAHVNPLQVPDVCGESEVLGRGTSFFQACLDRTDLQCFRADTVIPI